MRTRLLVTVLTVSVASGFGLSEVANFEIEKPKLVAEGESAHSTYKNCELYHDFSGWFWDIYYIRNEKIGDNWYVLYEHRPKGLNLWGDAHYVPSICSWDSLKG